MLQHFLLFAFLLSLLPSNAKWREYAGLEAERSVALEPAADQSVLGVLGVPVCSRGSERCSDQYKGLKGPSLVFGSVERCPC